MSQSPAGRRSTACVRCHKRKVKCSREEPCRNCHMANRECIYQIRDRNITVSESYVRDLKARAFARERDSQTEERLPASTDIGQPSAISVSSEGLSTRPPLVEDTTSEVFLARLKEIRQQNAFTSPQNLITDGDTPSTPAYDFVQLRFDTTDTPCTFSLPPYPYALALVEQFDIYLGHDWHWFLREDFKSRLELTYRHPSSSSAKDRVWLCTLLVVFALGESYNVGPPPEIRLGPSSTLEEEEQGTSRPPPGTAFFEQALALYKVRYEEPTIDQIESLNLITFYSYSLNRKRTAYVYAGLSARLSNILRLHKASTLSTLSPVQAEHVKRVWWTVYCLDRMTSTEMGLPPNFRRDETELAYPSDALVPVESIGQFSSGAQFATQVQLAFLHTDICETVKNLGDADPMRDQNRAEPILQRLQALKAGLPPELSYEVEDGLPIEMRQMKNRSLISVYERYYQCFVLLLRPFFLKQINYLLTNDMDNANHTGLTSLTNTCLRAARTNLLLIIGLLENDRLARFGFWESLHLFSGLTILSLAISVNSRWPGAFELKIDDETTYLTAKDVLREMARAGNLASKGQLRMLDEVEALRDDAFTWTDSTALDLLNLWDTDTWMY